MTDDVALTELRRTVASGEHLRRALVADLRIYHVRAAQAAVITEVVMFYGDAFEEVISAVLRVPAPMPEAAVRAMQSAIAGRAAFNTWRNADTSMGMPEELGVMASLWIGIVELLG